MTRHFRVITADTKFSEPTPTTESAPPSDEGDDVPETAPEESGEPDPAPTDAIKVGAASRPCVICEPALLLSVAAVFSVML